MLGFGVLGLLGLLRLRAFIGRLGLRAYKA